MVETSVLSAVQEKHIPKVTLLAGTGSYDTNESLREHVISLVLLTPTTMLVIPQKLVGRRVF
jgi:hypothetical protein